MSTKPEPEVNRPKNPDNTVRVLSRRLAKSRKKAAEKFRKEGKGTGTVKKSEVNEICKIYINALKGNVKSLKDKDTAIAFGFTLIGLSPDPELKTTITQIRSEIIKEHGFSEPVPKKTTPRPTRAAKEAAIRDSTRRTPARRPSGGDGQSRG